MAKITRKSYKRQKIVLGLTLFSAIALISTGFAAFVIAGNTSATQDGTIHIGTVKDGGVTIEGVTQSASEFVFDCKATDTTGRVYYEAEGGHAPENMAITISGTIGNHTYLKDLKIQMTVPSGITAAATADYIVLPDCVNAAQLVTVGDTGAFSYTIEFEWGTKFGGQNPGEYYDDPATGGSKELSVVKSELETFYSVINADSGDGYNVTLTATAKG